MSRHIKIVAEKGTDVTDECWRAFVDSFLDKLNYGNTAGGELSGYVEAELHIGGFPDIGFYAEMFKQFEGSNIALSLYDLDLEPDETFTL
jgi:hypothetical protein